MKRIAALPTMLTLGNAFCGFLAIMYVARAYYYMGDNNGGAMFGEKMEFAGWMIMLALVFDALDGKVARLVKGESNFGAQLDSLADAISFGVAPAIMAMAMSWQWGELANLGWASSALFMVCALLRLARYNVETEADSQGTSYFAGLPAPAAGGFVASLVIMRYNLVDAIPEDFALISSRLLPLMDRLAKYLPFLTVGLALLMVSRVRYIHLTNKLLKDQEAFGYIVGLVLLAFFFYFTRPFSIPLAFLIYIVWGLAGGFSSHKRDKKAKKAGNAANNAP